MMDSATTSVPQENCLSRNDDNSTTANAGAAALGDGNMHELLDLRMKEKQDKIIEQILKFQTDLVEKNSECERLKIKLDDSDRLAETLGRELDECKLTMFQNSEDSKKVHEEVQKNRKLEEDYVKLMSDFLNLSERHEQSRQDIYDKFMAKTNAIHINESSMSRDAMEELPLLESILSD